MSSTIVMLVTTLCDISYAVQNLYFSVLMMMNVLIELTHVLITRNVQILQVRAYQTCPELDDQWLEKF